MKATSDGKQWTKHAATVCMMLAILFGAMAWDAREHQVDLYPQTISYLIHGDSVDINIATTRYPWETTTAWVERIVAAWAAWEDRHAGIVLTVGDSGPTSGGDLSRDEMR